MAKVLRACGDLVSGFHRLECHADDCADLPTFCEYLEAKLELNKVTRIEHWDGAEFAVILDPQQQLPERATIRVSAIDRGQRSYPYTLHDASADGDEGTLAELLALGADPAEQVR
jgi:hypothetical protein